MKRIIIIAAILLLLVIVGISVYLYNSMDALVEGAIEKHGSRIMVGDKLLRVELPA